MSSRVGREPHYRAESRKLGIRGCIRLIQPATRSVSGNLRCIRLIHVYQPEIRCISLIKVSLALYCGERRTLSLSTLSTLLAV